MKKHILIHTGEKPFSCDFCAYASNQFGNLNVHKNKYHRQWIEKKSKMFLFIPKQKLFSNIKNQSFSRVKQLDLEVVNGLVHTVLRLWQQGQKFKLIFWFILEKNHLLVNSVNMFVIVKAVLIGIAKHYIEILIYCLKIHPFVSLFKYFGLIYFADGHDNDR